MTKQEQIDQWPKPHGKRVSVKTAYNTNKGVI